MILSEEAFHVLMRRLQCQYFLMQNYEKANKAKFMVCQEIALTAKDFV